MSVFYEVEPTVENYWRAIILFGRNAASYKFALAKAMYEFKDSPTDLISLERLAEPFSRHLCDHLKHSPKQVTSPSHTFIDACNQYNLHQLSQDELIATTVKLGFNDVIGAFHMVHHSDVPQRFFLELIPKDPGSFVHQSFQKYYPVQ